MLEKKCSVKSKQHHRKVKNNNKNFVSEDADTICYSPIDYVAKEQQLIEKFKQKTKNDKKIKLIRKIV